MSNPDNGGSAFPVIAENGLGHISDGLSKREWFAAHAPEPPLSWWGGSNPDCAGYALWNFQYAAAMLRESQKGQADD